MAVAITCCFSFKCSPRTWMTNFEMELLSIGNVMVSKITYSYWRIWIIFDNLLLLRQQNPLAVLEPGQKDLVTTVDCDFSKWITRHIFTKKFVKHYTNQCELCQKFPAIVYSLVLLVSLLFNLVYLSFNRTVSWNIQQQQLL